MNIPEIAQREIDRCLDSLNSKEYPKICNAIKDKAKRKDISEMIYKRLPEDLKQIVNSIELSYYER